MAVADIGNKLDELEEALIREALNQRWQHKYAKFGKQSQSLLVHAINAFSVAKNLGNDLFDLTDNELYLVTLAAFLHDFQKAESTWQKAAVDFMKGEKVDGSMFKHDSGSEVMFSRLEEFLSSVGKSIDNDLTAHAKRILNMIVYTHDSENTADSTRRRREVGTIDPLTRIVRLCDSIASIKDPKDIFKRQNDPDLPSDKKVKFEYHEIAVVRGVVSSFLNEAIIELMKKAGYIPLLYYANGAVYIRIGEKIEIEDTKKEIQLILNDQFRRFQDSDVYNTGMTNAVIGPLTQTKWPGLHLVREKDIEPLVRFITSMPATNKMDTFGDQYYDDQTKKKKEYKHALDKFIKITGSTSKSIILSDMTSDFNIIVYIFDFLKNYKEYITDNKLKDKYEQDVNTWLKGFLGEYTLEGISGISATSTVINRVEAISILWKIGTENLHKSKVRRERIRVGCIKLLKEVVRTYGEFSPPLIEDTILTPLLTEISHLPDEFELVGNIHDLANSVYETYSEGKGEKERICNLCGLKGNEDATAGLIGDGSEKFTNFLPGGIKLGAGKKAQVCSLCQLEATLRSFYFPSAPYGTLFVFPDISLSPSAFKLWAKEVSELVRTEHLGLGIGKSWNMLQVYKTLAKGEILDTAEALTRRIRPTKNELKEIVNYLSSKRESPEEVEFEYLVKEDIEMSFESIANAHINGIVRIDEYLLEDFRPKTKIQRTSVFTPSYCIAFLGSPLSDKKEEAPSTSALRTVLLSAILAEIFHARVVFVEGYQAIENFDFSGRIHVQLPTPAETAFRNLRIEPPIQTHEIHSLLSILTSLTLISMSYVKNLGKDRLLSLCSMNRGAILRRAQMEVEKKNWDKIKYDLLGLLDNLPAKAGAL